MSFTNILQAKGHFSPHNQSNNQSNPIHRINRGLKKGKFYCNKQNDPYQDNKHVPIQSQLDKKLSFKSLSKAKEESFYSNSKQKLGQKAIFSECFSRKNSSEKNLFKDNSIQRKLSFNQNRAEASNSKDKKLNFTQIIKKSKQRRPVEKSVMKQPENKVIKPPIKPNNTFSKLKSRLINQRSYLDPKTQNQSHEKTISRPNLQQFERVRISVQIDQDFQASQKLQLDMNPSL